MSAAAQAGQARLVLLVLDGLRPDVIDASATPHIAALIERGTLFTESRTVFPSITRVASASIATGAPVSVHGVVANAFYDARYDARRLHTFSTEKQIAAYEATVGEPLMMAETFADRLAAAGKSLAIVHTGSAPAAYVLNPRYRTLGQWKLALANVRAGDVSLEFATVAARFGPPPEDVMPGDAAVRYATDVFVDQALAEQRPDMALLWLHEPDKTWHYHGVTSAAGRVALRAADAAVGQVCDWIASRPDADRYTVALMSDHGHALTPREIDLYGMLSAAGHPCRHSADGALRDDALAVTGWMVGAIWPRQGGAARLRAVAEWLADQPFAGPIFASETAGGAPLSPLALPLRLTGAQHARQAPLSFAIAVDDAERLDDLAGVGPVIQGRDGRLFSMHGGLSEAELRNTLAISGPGFAAGARDDRACGVLDIAPTALRLLGVAPGRAMVGGSLADPAAPATRIVHELRHGEFHVRLRAAQRGEALFVQGAERVASG